MGIGSWDDGAVTDPAARATVVSAIKGLLTRIGGGLPAALAAGGGLKVEGVAGGVAQPASLALGSIGLPTTLVYGQTTVTTPGTEVTLGASATLYSGIKVKALHANTGWIYVGLNGVTSASGFVLDAGEEVFLEVANRATVFIDSSVGAEGVSYIGS